MGSYLKLGVLARRVLKHSSRPIGDPDEHGATANMHVDRRAVVAGNPGVGDASRQSIGCNKSLRPVPRYGSPNSPDRKRDTPPERCSQPELLTNPRSKLT
jgi:hypothetical protein